MTETEVEPAVENGDPIGPPGDEGVPGEPLADELAHAEQSMEVALRRLPDTGQLALAFGLPPDSISPNGFVLTNPDTSFEEWQQQGHVVSQFQRWTRFALGDWMLFGEALFGEDAAQAVEGTAADRYDVAQRITGLKPETITNYVSLCRRIPLNVRRVELGFSVHEAVAALERDDQVYWLEQAVVNGWDRGELRQAIKDAKNPPSDEPEVVDPEGDGDKSAAERAFEVLRLVWEHGQPTSDGGAVIDAETWAQVGGALGEN